MRKAFSTGFESDFYDWAGIPELTIPEGWMLVWLEEREQEKRPEWDHKKHPQPEKFEGKQAVAVHTRHARHHTAIYRQVRVNPGPVKVSGMVMLDSSPDAAHGCRLGFDPYGGDDFTAPTVRWSSWWAQTMKGWDQERDIRRWVPLNVDGDAMTDWITVFWLSKCDYAGDLAAAHLDLVQVWDTPTVDPGLKDAVHRALASARRVVVELEGILASLG